MKNISFKNPIPDYLVVLYLIGAQIETFPVSDTGSALSASGFVLGAWKRKISSFISFQIFLRSLNSAHERILYFSKLNIM